MAGQLGGRVVLVTGGTKGLGRGLVEAFVAAGAHVATCSRGGPSDSDLQGTLVMKADVRDPADAKRIVDDTAAHFGRLDVVINNAGGSPPSHIATASPRFVEKIVALNLLAPIWVAQAAYRIMSDQAEGGSIINIGSLSGARPSPGTAAYGAAKAGLANLTKSLAMEWAPKVRVNHVTVGYLLTEQAEMHYGDDSAVQQVAQTIPMRRLVEPADVAAVCVFLACDDARYLTGADIAVDGGGEPPPFLAAAASDPLSKGF